VEDFCTGYLAVWTDVECTPFRLLTVRTASTDIKCIGYGSNTRSDSLAVRGLARRLGGEDFGTPHIGELALEAARLADDLFDVRGSFFGLPGGSWSRCSRDQDLRWHPVQGLRHSRLASDVESGIKCDVGAFGTEPYAGYSDARGNTESPVSHVPRSPV